MSKIVWDKIGEHFYETGVDHGVLYVSSGASYATGVAWNGLTAVNESPSGAESSAQWADNIKYLNLVSAEEFGATIEAFYSPVEFDVCDGTVEAAPGMMIGQQSRKTFGFVYRTKLGNDQTGQDYGYKLHLIYNCTAAPSERSYATVNDSPEAATLSWEVTTTAVDVPGYKPTASITIDSTRAVPSNLRKLENILFGTETTEPRLPLPAEVLSIMNTPPAVTISTTAPDSTTEIGTSGKTVADFQTGILVRARDIAGNLKYVTKYTDYSNEPSEQSGNYLILKITADPESANIEAKMNTDVTYKTPDSNNCIVFRITNKDSQSIQIRATNAQDESVMNYALNALVLETALG